MALRLIALVAALGVMAAPAAAGPVKRGTYSFSPIGGKVSLSLQVSANGKKIDHFFLVVPTSCRIGRSRPHYPTTFSPTPDMRIKPGGRFGYSGVIRGPRPGAIQKWRVTGRFSADGRGVTATGRYTLRRPDGSCDTKTRTVKAPLTGLSGSNPFTGPYAGQTASGEAITFNVERGRVTDLRTRVTLKCDDGSQVTREIRVAELRLEDGDRFDGDGVHGRFPDQFSANGGLSPSEPLPATASDPEPGMCDADESFTAKPVRPLDS